MTTVPDIPVVQVHTFEEDGPTTAASMWTLDVPRGRRPSPLTLAVLGVVAGIAAMALGAGAVISAGAPSSVAPDPGVRASGSDSVAAGVERRVLALLAKPSTERIVFSSGGLVLAVGSGGRAAILVRGLERATPGKPYLAWIVAPGAAPVRAARFVGSERAVFLSRLLGPRASVVVSTARPVAGPAARNRVVAVRG